jgi:hypothetical protein
MNEVKGRNAKPTKQQAEGRPDQDMGEPNGVENGQQDLQAGATLFVRPSSMASSATSGQRKRTT